MEVFSKKKIFNFLDMLSPVSSTDFAFICLKVAFWPVLCTGQVLSAGDFDFDTLLPEGKVTTDTLLAPCEDIFTIMELNPKFNYFYVTVL